MKRRAVLASLGAVALLAAAGYGQRLRTAAQYDDAVAAMRRPLDLTATGTERLDELLRFASLAPNSHNTQGWTFAARPDGVMIAADPARRTPVVDPDDHHLFVSLGAAVETLIIAATAYGIIATPEIAADGRVFLSFAQGATAAPLLAAIARRQSHRGVYDASPLTAADRSALLAADRGLLLIEDALTRSALRDLTTAAYGVQMEDAAYRAELKSWLRFSEAAALQSMDGLFSGCAGSPALPQALGQVLFAVIVTATSQVAALRAQLDSTPALALLVTQTDTPAGQIDTGRRLQRISLAATAAGLSLAHVNPALENPTDRAGVARLCGIATGRPSILLRLGRTATPMPYSLRRPPQQILLS